jgi:hypothetical protein
MRRIQFTVGGLMALILCVGVAIAALRDASEFWGSVLFTLDLGLFGVAALGAAFLRGRGRAFCAGASVFGLGYLFLCFGPYCATEIKPLLATTRLLERLQPQVSSASATSFAISGNVMLSNQPTRTAAGPSLVLSSIASGPGSSTTGLWTILPHEPFQRVGHTLFALLFALLGGPIARRMADARGGEAGPSLHPVSE